MSNRKTIEGIFREKVESNTASNTRTYNKIPRVITLKNLQKTWEDCTHMQSVLARIIQTEILGAN